MIKQPRYVDIFPRWKFTPKEKSIKPKMITPELPEPQPIPKVEPPTNKQWSFKFNWSISPNKSYFMGLFIGGLIGFWFGLLCNLTITIHF